jgi:hypothetical protein
MLQKTLASHLLAWGEQQTAQGFTGLKAYTSSILRLM